MHTATPVQRSRSSALDTITASLVARQSRTDDGSMSVQDQIDKMREWCARQMPPVSVGPIYEETDVSGRKPLAKRHGLKRAVEDVESGRSQMILSAYFDRFARSVATRAEVLTRVEEKGGVVMTLDMGRTSNATPVSKFSGVVLAAAAELIADQAGEKTAVSKQRNIDRGVPPFPRITPAYVRRDDGTLEPHPTNGPLVAEACQMRARGVSHAKIARFLTESGLPMTITGVESMLSSRLLIGEIHFGTFTPNLRAIEQPITDHATFRKIQDAKSTPGRRTKSERLLARLGVLVCGTCGARMSVQSTKSSNGKSYPYYRCGNRLDCASGAVIAADVAEDFVVAETIRLCSEVSGRAHAAAEVEAARVALEAADSKLSNAIRTLASLSGEAATREVLDELQSDRDRAADALHRLAALSTPALTLTTSADWDLLSFDARRDLIHAVISRAVVAPGRGSDRVTIESREQ
jgi:DNA invertase Pin-like site-specific DNA recombinase